MTLDPIMNPTPHPAPTVSPTNGEAPASVFYPLVLQWADPAQDGWRLTLRSLAADPAPEAGRVPPTQAYLEGETPTRSQLLASLISTNLPVVILPVIEALVAEIREGEALTREVLNLQEEMVELVELVGDMCQSANKVLLRSKGGA